MYDRLVSLLRHCSETDCTECAVAGCPGAQKFCGNSASVIEELNKRIDFLMNCIYEAEDALDRGADNDWARGALEKAKRGQDDGE